MEEAILAARSCGRVDGFVAPLLRNDEEGPVIPGDASHYFIWAGDWAGVALRGASAPGD
jgi:hypothetical protein